MLDVVGVTRRFGARTVLDHISLSVPAGGSVALLGPSGVGKSTLLRCIAGLDTPDDGTITIDGVDVGAVPTHRRGVGFLFQDHALFPHLDVRDNVAFGLRMHKMPGRAARVAEVLDLVGLGHAIERNVADLFGGEAQRVALARALAPSPRLLLLDEPFGGLDRTRRDDLVIELRTLFDELGLTVVAVTHDPTEAAMLADRLVVLLDGGVAQDGPAGSVLTRPASSAVARLLGHPNVVAADAGGGVATSAVGRFPTSRTGPVGVVIPPDAIRISNDGDAATVIGPVWRDQQRRLRVTVGDIVLEATTDAEHHRGDEVHVSIDADAATVVDP